MNTKNTSLVVAGAVMLLALSACSKIPSAYRGNFKDNSSGAKLELNSGSGKMTFADGRVLDSDASELTYQDLITGKGGIFVRENPFNHAMVEGFWVNPNLATKQTAQGLTWFQSEVIYLLLNSELKDKVPGISFLHCTNGTVILDDLTKTFEAGCPASHDTFDMVRID